MLRENKVLIYDRIFSLTETCKTQSNHQAHEIIIPQLSQRHTVAHRILRGEKSRSFTVSSETFTSHDFGLLLAKNNIDQE